MKLSKKLLFVVVTSLVLAGCTATTPTSGQDELEKTGADAPKAAEEKKGDTVLTGMISKIGEKFFITVPGQAPKEIESYLVKLDEQVGKNITIVGQYSGDTLFVGKVQ